MAKGTEPLRDTVSMAIPAEVPSPSLCTTSHTGMSVLPRCNSGLDSKGPRRAVVHRQLLPPPLSPKPGGCRLFPGQRKGSKAV